MIKAEIRNVIPEWYNEVYAVHKLGWRWMAFDGIPIKGTPGYPQRQRVKQLFSPEQLADREWQDFLNRSSASEADGDEPLSYTYCSSHCSVASVPDLLGSELALKLNRLVHDVCGDQVPHDIGLKLVAIVRDHFSME